MKWTHSLALTRCLLERTHCVEETWVDRHNTSGRLKGAGGGGGVALVGR